MRMPLSIVLLLAAATPLSAVDWPVRNRVVTATFGESRGDRFLCGIDIGGGEQDVFPVLEGELIFSADEDGGRSSVPRGLGSVAVLSHEDGLLSAYGHLKAGSVAQERRIFPPGVRIGVSGGTGSSGGTRLHLMFLDGESGAFLNPLGLLPPLADRQAPVIREIQTRSGSALRSLGSGFVLPAVPMEILVEAYDPRADVPFLWPMAPYSIQLSLNGEEVSRILFESVIVKDGRSRLSGSELGAKDVYAGDRLLRCATITPARGESHLMVSVRDHAGNESVREVFLKTGDR